MWDNHNSEPAKDLQAVIGAYMDAVMAAERRRVEFDCRMALWWQRPDMMSRLCIVDDRAARGLSLLDTAPDLGYVASFLPEMMELGSVEHNPSV